MGPRSPLVQRMIEAGAVGPSVAFEVTLPDRSPLFLPRNQGLMLLRHVLPDNTQLLHRVELQNALRRAAPRSSDTRVWGGLVQFVVERHVPRAAGQRPTSKVASFEIFAYAVDTGTQFRFPKPSVRALGRAAGAAAGSTLLFQKIDFGERRSRLVVTSVSQ